MATFSSGRFKGRKSPPWFLPALPSSTTHHCGPVPARNADPPNQLGGQPPRARKPYPQSSALRLCRPPLRFALSTAPCSVTRVGRPLSLPLLPPAFARWRSACMLTCHCHDNAKTRSNNHDDQESTPQDFRPSPYPAFTSPPPTHAAPSMNPSWPSLPILCPGTKSAFCAADRFVADEEGSRMETGGSPS